MTVTVLTLYRLKLKMFLGPIRQQPAMAVALLVVAIVFLPGAFGFGYFLPDQPFGALDLLEVGALALSMLAALVFLAAPGGGLMLQPAEVDFVAVAPVPVRRFLLADVFFQATVFGLGLPVVALATAGYAVRIGAPLWAFLVPVASLSILLFVVVFLVQGVGVARLLRRRWAAPLIALALVAFVAPVAVRFLLRLPTVYAALPYPTTAAVQVALLPFGHGHWTGLPILAAYALVALAVHRWAAQHPTLPNLRATFAALSFTTEAKRMQQIALLRAFGRLRTARASRLYRPTLSGTMAALHLARMTRDGSLILFLAVALGFGIPFVFAGASFSFGGAYLVLFLPVAAVGQWMATDRPNLWILLTAGGNPAAFFVGWWIALGALVAAVGAAVSFLAGLAGAGVEGIAVATSVTSALGATAGSVLAAAQFPYTPNQFSVRPILHFFLTVVFAGVGALPILALGIAFASAPFLLPLVVVAATAILAWVFRDVVAKGARNPEL